MKQKSWISIVFSFASQCRGKIVLSVLCAIISVVAGLIPYWSVYQIITLFIDGSPVMAEVWKWCWIRAWRLCDTLLALWYFNEPVPHIRLYHFGEYSFGSCPAADESAAGDSYRRVCG